jgi:hypothetical protein
MRGFPPPIPEVILTCSFAMALKVTTSLDSI